MSSPQEDDLAPTPLVPQYGLVPRRVRDSGEDRETSLEEALASVRACAVIPAFNEVTSIAQVVADTLPYVQRVIVVDDASADGTGEAALVAGASVLRHPVNLGQGAALQTGLSHALATGATHIVTLDADGQHDPRQIERMISQMTVEGVDVALGSRFKGEAVGMPRSKRIILGLAVTFTRMTTRLDLSDSHNGFRVFSASAARQVRIRQNRMAHASEILEEISRHRISYIEVPVTVRYTDYSKAKGQSSGNSLNILLDLALHWLRK